MTALSEITSIVADDFGVSVQDLLGPCRERQFAWPRQRAYALCREVTGKSYPEIARFFHRDHTTILHGVQADEARRNHADNRAFREQVEKLQADAVFFRHNPKPEFKSARKAECKF